MVLRSLRSAIIPAQGPRTRAGGERGKGGEKGGKKEKDREKERERERERKRSKPGIVSIMDMVVKRAIDSVCSKTYKFTMYEKIEEEARERAWVKNTTRRLNFLFFFRAIAGVVLFA